MLTVTFFYREPRRTGFSIEGIFRLVRSSLADTIEVKEFYCDAGLSRVQNIRKAGKAATSINHITGDVNFLALGLRGKKNVLTIHDFGYYENPVHSRRVRAMYKLFWFTLPLRYISAVTVVSQFTKEKLMQYFNYPEDRIYVVPNPLKPVFLHAPKVKINDRPIILMMGTGRHKNLHNLIEAAKGVDVHIDIVGWPHEEDIARLDAYRISYTVYNGLSDDDIYRRYVACDMLFIASLYEGFGMPIIEAQAVGRPVITSDTGAMKEIGEGSSILVDPHDPVSIRNGILLLISDSSIYDEYVHKGFANAAKFEHGKIAAQYLQVYKDLEAKKGK